MFDRWEDYWSHRLHPVYFGRSVVKKAKYIPPKETSPFILEAMTPLDEDVSDSATATDSYVKKLLEDAQAVRNAAKSGDTVASSVPLQVERYPMVRHVQPLKTYTCNFNQYTLNTYTHSVHMNY